MSLKPEIFSQISEFPSQSILLVDSGVGSLVINHHISQLLPDFPIISIGDQLNFPYGCKDESFIEKSLFRLIDFGLKEFNPQVIVVACNSASTFILPILRKYTEVPIVGVVPPIKPAAEKSQTKVVGVLSTEKTATTPYLKGLVETFAVDCEVIIVPCEDLATLAEKKVSGGKVDVKDLSKELDPILSHTKYTELDSLVLGCTHFSILREEIQNLLRVGVKIYDPADAIARQVLKVLPKIDLNESKNENWFLSTSLPEHKNYNFYESLGIKRIIYI